MTAKGKINASKVQAGDRIIVRNLESDFRTGTITPSDTRTGEGVRVARVIGKTFRAAQGRYEARGKYVVETTEGNFEAAPIQTMFLAPEDAAGIKRAHVEALAENVARNLAVTPERRHAAMERMADENAALAEDRARTAVDSGECPLCGGRLASDGVCGDDTCGGEDVASEVMHLAVPGPRILFACGGTEAMVGTEDEQDVTCPDCAALLASYRSPWFVPTI